MTNNTHPVRMTVSPHQARTWMDKNHSNRGVSKHVVEKYAEDMSNGNWRDNGEAIKIGPEGQLLDGQHRCAAVILSDKEISTIVVFNVDPSSVITMDSGRARSFNDQLRMDGEASYRSLGAITKGAKAWVDGDRGFQGQKAKSNTVLLHFLQDNPDLRTAVLAGYKLRSAQIGLSEGIGGTLYWVFSRLDQADADDFFDKLVRPDHEEGSPILALRESLRNELLKRRGKGPLNRRWTAAVTIKAWNKYRMGESAKFMRFAPGGANPEKFPEPI